MVAADVAEAVEGVWGRSAHGGESKDKRWVPVTKLAG